MNRPFSILIDSARIVIEATASQGKTYKEIASDIDVPLTVVSSIANNKIAHNRGSGRITKIQQQKLREWINKVTLSRP